MKTDLSSVFIAFFTKCGGEQLSEVMSLVIRVVNFIVARALHDRQFKALLDEVGNANPGLLLHSNVRWLSRGKVQAELASQHKWTEIKNFHTQTT
ncbi:General transcription factor II-I repeat domain-containing protein 2-like [Caligus rogercresseyi]|uniref:General transcription factor II-I repeat domain-containing protein 2-like n=1 Tax=Caligus rogercresseyi TaxID=217165 RepID=A0A7T8GM96_CALRO|nr:General transcription factor II-I repeat domain-containing protein 2-like [Caligus rogercresseyi]QQP33166.1 General transcription factor II-I repeat domain-containing protein 2-like [Caligus rogercresseyi]